MFQNLSHPKGEVLKPQIVDHSTPCELDTFDGSVSVEWEPGEKVTPLGVVV